MLISEEKESIINNEKRGVPFFDVDFIGGYDLVENNQTIIPAYYIDFPEYNDSDMWINMTGKSMEPTLWHGDKINVKELNDWNTYLLYGEIYALVTDQYRTVKIVRRSKLGDDYLRLIPVNPDFDEQDIPKSIIKRVYTVKRFSKKIILNYYIMRKTILIIIFTVFSTYIFSQLSIGIESGLNTSISTTENTYLSGSAIIGINGEYNFFKNSNIGVGIRYSDIKYTDKVALFNESGENIGDKKITYSTASYMIPVYFKQNFDINQIKIYGKLGINMSILAEKKGIFEDNLFALSAGIGISKKLNDKISISAGAEYQRNLKDVYSGNLLNIHIDNLLFLVGLSYKI